MSPFVKLTGKFRHKVAACPILECFSNCYGGVVHCQQCWQGYKARCEQQSSSHAQQWGHKPEYSCCTAVTALHWTVLLLLMHFKHFCTSMPAMVHVSSSISPGHCPCDIQCGGSCKWPSAGAVKRHWAGPL